MIILNGHYGKRFREWKVDGNDSNSCPMARFGISCVEQNLLSIFRLTQSVLRIPSPSISLPSLLKYSH
jgi:hypothetical protein